MWIEYVTRATESKARSERCLGSHYSLLHLTALQCVCSLILHSTPSEANKGRAECIFPAFGEGTPFSLSRFSSVSFSLRTHFTPGQRNVAENEQLEIEDQSPLNMKHNVLFSQSRFRSPTALWWVSTKRTTLRSAQQFSQVCYLKPCNLGIALVRWGETSEPCCLSRAY